MIFISYFKKWIQTLLVLLLCVSCSMSIPRSTVYYINEDTHAPDIWPKIVDETPAYNLSLGALGNVSDALLFEVNVTNKSMDSLLIEPHKWQMYTTKSYVDDWEVLDTVQLMNTGQIAQMYDDLANQMQQVRRNERTALIVAGVILVVGVLVAIANAEGDADNDNDGDLEVVNFMANSYIDHSIGVTFYSPGPRRINRDRSFDDRIPMIFEEANRFRESNMEPIKIAPQEDVFFDVYFRIPKKLKDFELRWMLNEENLNWHFYHVIDDFKSREMIGIPSGL